MGRIKKNKRMFKWWLCCLCSFSVVGFAQADEDLLEEDSSSNEDREQQVKERKTLASRVPAVSGHRFLKAKRFELSPTFSFSTNDAFFRRLNAGARLAYHFNEYLSLDAGLGYVLAHQNMNSVRSTDESTTNNLIDENRPNLLFDVGLGFSPIYGKMALSAEAVLHFDLYITAGLGGVMQTTHPCAKFWPTGASPNASACNTQNPGQSAGGQSGMGLGFNYGFGGRFIVNRFFALRTEVRNTRLVLEGANTNISKTIRMLGIGGSFFFPMNFDVEHTYRAIED